MCLTTNTEAALLPARPGRPLAGLPAVRLRGGPTRLPRPLDRLAGAGPPQVPASGGAQCKISAVPVGLGAASRQPRAGAGGPPAAGRLAAGARFATGSVRDLCRPATAPGTCYRAAGWQCLGRTTGARATASQPARTPKQVWVRPLRQDFRSILLNGPPQRTRQRREPASADASFVQLWQGLIGTLTRVASAYDREWVRRQRTLNTLLVATASEFG